MVTLRQDNAALQSTLEKQVFNFNRILHKAHAWWHPLHTTVVLLLCYGKDGLDGTFHMM